MLKEVPAATAECNVNLPIHAIPELNLNGLNASDTSLVTSQFTPRHGERRPSESNVAILNASHNRANHEGQTGIVLS